MISCEAILREGGYLLQALEAEGENMIGIGLCVLKIVLVAFVAAIALYAISMV